MSVSPSRQRVERCRQAHPKHQTVGAAGPIFTHASLIQVGLVPFSLAPLSDLVWDWSYFTPVSPSDTARASLCFRTRLPLCHSMVFKDILSEVTLHEQHHDIATSETEGLVLTARHCMCASSLHAVTW